MHICSFVVAAESHVSEPSADLVFSMMSQIVQDLMCKFWKYGTDICHGGHGKDLRVHGCFENGHQLQQVNRHDGMHRVLQNEDTITPMLGYYRLKNGRNHRYGLCHMVHSMTGCTHCFCGHMMQETSHMNSK